MSVPDTHELSLAARKIVHNGRKKGLLSTLTPRLVRQDVEKLFSLPRGTLDADEYKKQLKSVISAALAEDYNPDEANAPDKEPKRVEAPPRPVKPKAPSSSKGKGFKSAEHIATSDMEDDDNEAPQVVKASPSKGSGNAHAAKRRRVDSDADSDGEHQVEEAQPKPSTSNSALTETKGEKSDSELSVLIDEPPKRKKKAKTNETSSGKSKKAAAPKAAKKPGAELSKDEETIKRLKSLVVACGVRKVWSKAFQGIDKPSQQIKKLREILAELGMSGRMSLEQAKAIKEKRELAKELEDVRSFEQAVVGRSSRSRTPTKPAGSNAGSDAGSASEGDAVLPVKRKNTARRSIMAFLDDQSDDE